MTHGMTHNERHSRRAIENGCGSPALVFLDHIRTGRKVSKWKLFIWSLNGLIPIMDDVQLRERYGEEAYAVLVAEQKPSAKSAEKEKKGKSRKPKLKRKKRRLMPQDYAWLLRESGRKYEAVPDPRKFYESPRSGHKRMTAEEVDQKKAQKLHEWWIHHTDEISVMKEKAAARRARKKLRHFRESIFNRREQEMLGRKTVQEVAIDEGPRTAYLRIKAELYELICCGECPVFVWKEKPGYEDMLQPNAYGDVKRIAVRPPGGSMKTPWAVFELEWARRKLREGITNSEWVWEIGVGERIRDDGD